MPGGDDRVACGGKDDSRRDADLNADARTRGRWPRRSTRPLRFILWGVLTALACGLAAWLLLGLIPPPLLANQANSSIAVTDRDGHLLRLTLTGDEKYRLWTPLAQLPASLRAATLNYEDRHFYCHPGVNPAALARAGVESFILRNRLMGGSTLSMQLARQRWKLKTRTLTGKLRQIGYALWLERHFTKDQILEAYLNVAPYGANIEGAGAAAWVFFGKPTAQLNADEARALALIPQNPNERAPLTPAGQTVLRRAWANAYGTDPGFDRLWFRRREDLPKQTPHFAERLRELHPSGAAGSSTLDSTVQKLAEGLLANVVRQRRGDGIANGAVMVVRVPSREVLGYVGSAGYLDSSISGFVNGLKARRSPGSTLKPFIYALALDQGLITPDTLLKDTPLRVSEYQPENFERDFYGPLSATEALVRSRNIPAISLMAQLRKPGLYGYMEQAGVRFAKDEAAYGLALATGGAEISMEELLTLYGVLADGGEYRPLRWLKDGPEEAAPKPLISAEAAYLTLRMLEANPRPQRVYGGRSFTRDAVPVAWKTGTSSGQKDAWAVGLMGDVLAGVWIGNFDGSGNRHLVGRDTAGPLLFGLLDALRLEGLVHFEQPKPPGGLKSVEVCPVSGAPRSTGCPHGKPGWLIAGVSPAKPCTVHRQIHVDPASGLRLCRNEEGRGQARVAEFWESDLLDLFRQAGLRRETPPPFAQACEDLAGADAGPHPPAIVSPQAHMRYPIRPGGGSRIEFSAIAGAGRNRLFWFVDDAFVGEGSPVFWQAKPGQFEVRVVDEQGQSAAVSLNSAMEGD